MIVKCYRRAARPILTWRNLLKSEAGASLVEYALLVGLIALVCVVAVTYFGSSVNSSFSHTGSAVGP